MTNRLNSILINNEKVIRHHCRDQRRRTVVEDDFHLAPEG